MENGLRFAMILSSEVECCVSRAKTATKSPNRFSEQTSVDTPSAALRIPRRLLSFMWIREAGRRVFQNSARPRRVTQDFYDGREPL
jgi:hypothetical protein